MTLSTCSMCKNAADGVCLLGQSYIDVFQSVQAIDDEARREQITHQLACCSFWEESDLAKQISREVTLSQHAWSRIAYIKLQKVDQAMFAGLVDVARSVLHSHDHEPTPEPQPASALNAAEPASNPAELSEPQPAITLKAAEPASNPAEPSEPQPEISEHQEDPMPSLSLVESPPVVDPPLTAADPMEQAMQQLWSMAEEIQASTPEGVEALSAQWGRGSGRASDSPDGEPALNHRVLPTIV